MMPELVSLLMPGDRPSLAWLGYGRHHSPARRILRAARPREMPATWREIEEAKLDTDDQAWIARGLTAAGMNEEAACLRTRIKEAAGDGSSRRS